MSTPTLDVGVFAGLCEPGMRPLALTQLLRLWLTHHFGNTAAPNSAPQASRLEYSNTDGPVQRMVWTDTPATGIAIEADWAWTPKLTERRPAILISRGKQTRVPGGIADKMQGTFIQDGNVRHTVIWQGAHQVICVGGEGAEVEILASETARELVQFSQVVRATLDMKKLTVTGYSEVEHLDESRANFAVRIELVYAYEESYIVRQTAPPLVAGAPGISTV